MRCTRPSNAFKRGFEILQGLALMSRICSLSSLWKFAQIWSLRRYLTSSSLHMFSKNLLRVWQFIFLNMKYFLNMLIPPFHELGSLVRLHRELQAPSTLSYCSSKLLRDKKAQGTWPETTLLSPPAFCSCLARPKATLRWQSETEWGMRNLEVIKYAFCALKSYETIAELLCSSGETHIL